MAVDGVHPRSRRMPSRRPRRPRPREWVVAALRRVDFGHRERIVRINAAGTPEHAADLAAVVPVGLDALLLPEARRGRGRGAPGRGGRSGSSGRAAGRPAASGSTSWSRPSPPSSASRRWRAPCRGRRPSSTGRGTCRARRARALVPDRLTELYAMSRIVLVARATGLDAIDSPCFDLGQPERLETPHAHRRRPRLRREGPHPSEPDRGGEPLLHAVSRGRRRGPTGARGLRGRRRAAGAAPSPSTGSSSMRFTSTWRARRWPRAELAAGGAA